MMSGIFDLQHTGISDVFSDPAETLSTLLHLLPRLPEPLRKKVKTYIRQEYQTYPPQTVAHAGWGGAPREDMLFPPDGDPARTGTLWSSTTGASRLGWSKFGWGIPPFNYYALWQYAAVFGVEKEMGDVAKQIAPPQFNAGSMPFVLNSLIAGYVGAYRLGMKAGIDATELKKMEQILADLFITRAALCKAPESLAAAGFEWGGHGYSLFTYDPATGEAAFSPVEAGGWLSAPKMYYPTFDFFPLTPPLARFLRDYARAEVAHSVAAYNERQPYWFVGKSEETSGEGVHQPLQEGIAYFQARAMVLQQPRAELEKYLDVPAFTRSDLYYLQKVGVCLTAP
jgi:hypothetical protein